MMGGNRVRTLTLLGVLGLLLLVVLAWFLLLAPRLAKADEVAGQVEQAETANLQLQNRVNQTRSLAAQAPEAAAEAQELFATMPNAAELPTVLRQITEAAGAAGIGPTNVQVISTTVPATVTPAGQGGVALAEMDLGLTVLGSRSQLLAFLDNLQNLDRAILVTGTQVTGSADDQGSESLQVQGTMFVLQSELPDLVAEVERLLAEAGAAASASPEAG